MRTGLPQVGEGGGPGKTDGVVLRRLAPAEAVEDYQHHRPNRVRHGVGILVISPGGSVDVGVEQGQRCGRARGRVFSPGSRVSSPQSIDNILKIDLPDVTPAHTCWKYGSLMPGRRRGAPTNADGDP